MILKALAMTAAVAAAFINPESEPGHSYRLIAAPAGVTEVGFVDASSIVRKSTGASYWWLVVYQPPAAMKGGPRVVYQLRQRIADCAQRRTRDSVVVAHLENGDDRWLSLIGRFRPARAGSVAESELAFVCEGKLVEPEARGLESIDEALRFVAAAHKTAEHAMPPRADR